MTSTAAGDERLPIPQFVVGIDLGTSNTAVAYAELCNEESNPHPTIEAWEILQLTQPGDVQARHLLPSALYIPASYEIASEDLRLPWAEGTQEDHPPCIVGVGARKLGAKTPIRLIESAKSWLCHGGVQRTAKILPNHAPEEIPKFSPVEAAEAVLEHVCTAWNYHMARQAPDRRLEYQKVVLTVPASFDEAARQLTLQAAKRAGLSEIQLIEEPLAAFYAYIARTGGTAATTGLQGGETILIADVGGGTTDFTLIRVFSPEHPDQPLHFERTAVGDHLLLGGDNMDLALAHGVEPSLRQGQPLDAESWAQLRQECRLAKESLLSYPEQEKLPITIAGRSRRLIQGSLRAELTRSQLATVVLEGYFPSLPKGDEARPDRQTTGFSEYGLPYATDPRITRHLARFLLDHAAPGPGDAPHIDAVLFNGGALKPVSIRDRLTSVLGDWLRQTAHDPSRPDPRALVWDEGDTALELAVARGAAYFGLVKLGRGLRVHGGSAQSYYLGLGDNDQTTSSTDATQKVLCVAPRGMQDGQTLEVSEQQFQLLTNRPVVFPLYVSSQARRDPVGAILDINVDAQEFHELAPLQTVIKFGKQKAGTPVPVRIQAHRTELGTLELSCLSKMSGSRFRLEFDLRGGATPTSSPPSLADHRAPPNEGEISSAQMITAQERLHQTFGETQERLAPNQLMKGLEEDLGLNRDAFPLSALRELAEQLLEMIDNRALRPELEARWLNLVGFCLRPGWGVPLDDWRVRQLWRIHSQGPIHASHSDVALNWWILWRRVAGGLVRGHQEELAARLFPLLIPSLAKRAKRKPPKPQSQEAAEMWRAAAALEHISAKQRTQLGDALMELLESKKSPKSGLWCLSRIGARRLLYGPREATIKPSKVSTWLTRLYAIRKWPEGTSPITAIVALARYTGDRQLDVPETVRKEAVGYLRQQGVLETVYAPLLTLVEENVSAQSTAFGDSLPVGIRL
ncbi:MAG: hsp70 family protein [Myxococcales bacterium]|nr:hsp70 family protein [Myxococcales bacterium]